MKKGGKAKRIKKVREPAVLAVEEWEEEFLDEVVEEMGDRVENSAEEVLGMVDAVPDKEVAVAEKRKIATVNEVAAEAEPASEEEGEEDSPEEEADTTGEAVEDQVQQELGKQAVQGKEDAVLKDRQGYSVEGAEKQYVAFPMLARIEDFKSKVPIDWAKLVAKAIDEGFPAQFHGTAYMGGEDTEARVVNLTVKDYICARRKHKDVALFEEGLNGCAHKLHIASGEAFFLACKELA